MKPRKVVLTAEQNALFDSRIRHWRQRLWLMDWRVERASDRAPGAMADVRVDYEGRLATYRIGNFAGYEVDAALIDRIALHEALHVLLAEVLHLTAENAAETAKASAEHRVIHILEQLLAAP